MPTGQAVAKRIRDALDSKAAAAGIPRTIKRFPFPSARDGSCRSHPESCGTMTGSIHTPQGTQSDYACVCGDSRDGQVLNAASTSP